MYSPVSPGLYVSREVDGTVEHIQWTALQRARRRKCGAECSLGCDINAMTAYRACPAICVYELIDQQQLIIVSLDGAPVELPHRS